MGENLAASYWKTIKNREANEQRVGLDGWLQLLPGTVYLSLLLGQVVTLQALRNSLHFPGTFQLGFGSYAQAVTALLAPIIQCEHRCVGKHFGAIC